MDEMKKCKWLGFLLVVVSCFFVFGFDTSKAQAEELTTTEVQSTFDLTKNEIQQSTIINEEGEEITITIEPIDTPITNIGKSASSSITPLASHLFPYGTSTYKVSAYTPYLGISYYIKVYVPSGNIDGSKITSAYDANYWIIGGYLSNTKLTRSNKEAKYSADAIWMGGLGAANVYLKATLSGNKLTTSSRM
jgi:hypothetical protein